MIQEEAQAVGRAMMKYGGSFVSALGQALIRADENNAQTIKWTWPGYWEEYKQAAKRCKE